MIKYPTQFFTTREEEEIKREMQQVPDSICKRRERNFLLILFAVLIVSFLSLSGSSYACEESEVLFPNTWSCSKCGYENYEGISPCAQCGGS